MKTRRFYYLPISELEPFMGEKVIVATSQKGPLVPMRLIVPSDVANHFVIRNIDFDQRPQLIDSIDPIPARLFSETSITAPFLDGPTTTFSLSVENVGAWEFRWAWVERRRHQRRRDNDCAWWEVPLVFIVNSFNRLLWKVAPKHHVHKPMPFVGAFCCSTYE